MRKISGKHNYHNGWKANRRRNKWSGEIPRRAAALTDEAKGKKRPDRVAEARKTARIGKRAKP